MPNPKANNWTEYGHYVSNSLEKKINEIKAQNCTKSETLEFD